MRSCPDTPWQQCFIANQIKDFTVLAIDGNFSGGSRGGARSLCFCYSLFASECVKIRLRKHERASKALELSGPLSAPWTPAVIKGLRASPSGACDVHCAYMIFCAPSIWKSWIRPCNFQATGPRSVLNLGHSYVVMLLRRYIKSPIIQLICIIYSPFGYVHKSSLTLLYMLIDLSSNQKNATMSSLTTMKWACVRVESRNPGIAIKPVPKNLSNGEERNKKACHWKISIANRKMGRKKQHGKSSKQTTVEPHYKRGPWDHENYLVISGFSLYQGKKTKKYKLLGPAKLPCYKRVMLYPTSL